MIEALSTSQSFFFTSLTFLGLIIGSFLNVVAYRLPIILKAQWRRDCLSFIGEIYEESEELSDGNGTVLVFSCVKVFSEEL